MTYDVSYFIEKFSKIPEELWKTGSFGFDEKIACAKGHCYNGDDHANVLKERIVYVMRDEKVRELSKAELIEQ